MKRWNQFQEWVVEKISGAVGQRVPALQEVTVPEIRASLLNRGAR